MSFLVAGSIAMVIYLAGIAAVVVYVGRGIPSSPPFVPPLPKRRNTMKVFCTNCNSIQPASFRPTVDAVAGKHAHDLSCDTCNFIEATVTELCFTEAQKDEFDALTDPLIAWLNNNTNPHYTVVITPTSAELLSGEIAYSTEKHVKD